MITAHPLIQVYLIAPQLLLWIALAHHGDSILASSHFICRCSFYLFGQHAVMTRPLLRPRRGLASGRGQPPTMSWAGMPLSRARARHTNDRSLHSNPISEREAACRTAWSMASSLSTL